MLKRIAFALLAVSFLAPTVVLADGMIVPRPDRYVWETEQKAVIFYENNQETLVLSVSFQGNAEDFAWIVPTPSRPEVSKSSDELFTSLQELTAPIYDYPQPMPLRDASSVGYDEQGVYVLETKQIDYYKITVLEANNVDSLSQWLKDNGYQYPESGKYILDSYIKSGWYFTAIKIVDDYASANIEYQLNSGHAIPLKLEFAASKIVYPLKISAIEHQNNIRSDRYYQNQQLGILLYVITDNKQELPQFSTQYAGWLKKNSLENLAYDDNGNAWLRPAKDKYFLSKLYRLMTRAEMNSDLYLRQAGNNTTVNAPDSVESKGFTGFIVAMLVGGLVMIGLLVILLVSGMRKK
ncbi:hypothetical protein A3B87_03055 [Candidatus Kuenenbacteria bacterium RIFCSPHIGHO2_02_FULL_39_13]|uniref:DUF2330 domain-containing protein n=1 Tax=Candidatus Kuenenbacteria bacterium RIFCSPHIGHO2_02_FULL_39_13 TaxID=1798561 RepID=A0A1F6FLD4_9BACT|nr:MAG: hypothetical protein A3B87_03055 [Candidatus Kuenenbacteria bacterium RIFCSPHIGHO2_02_FULL_39_13]